MTNPMINPQPNYSGVTIQIANPSVYASDNPRYGTNGYIQKPANMIANGYQEQGIVNPYYQGEGYNMIPGYVTQPIPTQNLPYLQDTPQLVPNYNVQQQPLSQPPAYPPQYYLNNYNYQNNGIEGKDEIIKAFKDAGRQNNPTQVSQILPEEQPVNMAAVEPENLNKNAETMDNETKKYDVPQEEPQDFSKSQAVIDDLDARALAKAEEKKNSKTKNIVALTDEYIKSLENYLNNPNDEIRLMASKEILTRLDEDKDRKDDAALNALLNKMLQDPSKLIRVAALSAFSSQLATGNEYTVTLLHNIQQNPNADKEDVLQAADILLKMSTGTEVKQIPNPAVKESGENNKGQ